MDRFALEALLFTPSEEDSYLLHSSSSDSDGSAECCCSCDCSCSDDDSSSNHLVANPLNKTRPTIVENGGASNLENGILSAAIKIETGPVPKKMKVEPNKDDLKVTKSQMYNLRTRTSNSSNDQASEQDKKKTKTEGYVEVEVPKLSDLEFMKHFRVSKRTYQQLVDLLHDDFVNSRRAIYPEKACLLILWYLGSEDSYRQISDKFQVTVSSIHEVIKTGTSRLCSILNQYVKFPEPENYAAASEGLYMSTEIKDAIGVLGVSHCRILMFKNKKAEDENVYLNSESSHSVALQAVVDHDRKFLDLFVAPGSLSNVEIFARSSLNDLKENWGNHFLLCDASYPAQQWLVPPFGGGAQLPAEQRLFNEQVDAATSLVRESFCMLKGRFRRLAHLKNEDPEMVERLAKAACVLHNMCLDNDETNDSMMLEEDEGFIPSRCADDSEGDWKRYEVFSACMHPDQPREEFLYEEYLPDPDTNDLL